MSEIALLLDEIRGMKRRLQALETVQEHPGFAASDVARLSIANTFADTNTFESDVIVEGDLTVDQDAFVTGDVLATGIVQAAAAWISGVAVSLNAKLYCGFNGNEPYETTYTGSSTGHRGQVGTESGGVIYRPGKFGKAVQIAEATTNLITNPSFETNTTGWSTQTGGETIARVTTDAYYGSACLKFTGSVSYAYGRARMTGIGVSASTTYTMTLWVKAASAADVGKNVRLSLIGNSSGETASASSTALTSNWQRVSLSKTTNGSDSTLIAACVLYNDLSGASFLLDGVQLEAKAYATPYCDGSLGSGHSWSGTAHASTSSRADAKLSYAASVLPVTAGTLAFWYYNPAVDGVVRRLILAYTGTSDQFYLQRSAAGYAVWNVNGTTIFSSAPLATGWNHIAMTWSGGTRYLYVNGVANSSGAIGSWTQQTMYVGSYSFADNNGNGLFDELAVLTRAATADEIRAIYESNAQLICS